LTYPSEKYESQLGLLFPTEWKNKLHVPNHQSVYINIYIYTDPDPAGFNFSLGKFQNIPNHLFPKDPRTTGAHKCPGACHLSPRTSPVGIVVERPPPRWHQIRKGNGQL
jgi:hypothetical protein